MNRPIIHSDNQGDKPYVISWTYDDRGQKCWYVHHRGYPHIPVFGSFGDKAHAKQVCKIYNSSCGQ